MKIPRGNILLFKSLRKNGMAVNGHPNTATMQSPESFLRIDPVLYFVPLTSRVFPKLRTMTFVYIGHKLAIIFLSIKLDAKVSLYSPMATLFASQSVANIAVSAIAVPDTSLDPTIGKFVTFHVCTFNLTVISAVTFHAAAMVHKHFSNLKKYTTIFKRSQHPVQQAYRRTKPV